MCSGGSLQPGSRRYGNPPLPGLDTPPSTQDVTMDETQAPTISPREDEGQQRASDIVLLERVRDRYYERVIALRRAITSGHPNLDGPISSLIRFSVQLGRFESELLRESQSELTEEEGFTSNEDND